MAGKMRMGGVSAMLPLLVGMIFAGAALPSRAQTSAAGSVSLDVGGLNGLGLYYLDFQLLDGNGSGDGNAAAAISNLTLAGGSLSAPGTATTIGTVSGDPTTAGGLQLVDSDPGGISEYVLGFQVGSATAPLNFDLTVTGTSLDVPWADQFNFQILDSGMNPLPTSGPTGSELVNTTLDSPAPGFGAYGTDPGSTTITIAAPTIAVTTPPIGAAAPEPSSLALVAAAGVTILGGVRKRRLR